MIEQTELRSIPGFPGYFVAADGRVWSEKRFKFMKSHRHKRGYIHVALWNARKCVTRSVHHLVLEAWVGPRPAGAVARHLDGNPTNNQVSNLAWGTQQENAIDRAMHGTVARHERHGKAKLTFALACEARKKFARGANVKKLANEYGVNTGTMSKLVRNITWRVPS